MRRRHPDPDPAQLSDKALDILTRLSAVSLELHAERLEALLAEGQRRGAVQLALNEVAFAYLADRQRLAEDQPSAEAVH